MGESCMGNRNLAIFDFDGTIADSAAWFGDALNELARHNGFREVSAEQREMLRGRSSREIFAYLGIPSWKLPLVVRQLREIAARDVEQISIFPWVPDVFAALQSRGISIAIVSSNTKANIRRVLGAEVASMIDQFGTGAPLFGKAAKINAVIKRCASAAELTTSIGDEVRDIEAARPGHLQLGGDMGICDRSGAESRSAHAAGACARRIAGLVRSKALIGGVTFGGAERRQSLPPIADL
jgi:phosphoglycolate phosphatase